MSSASFRVKQIVAFAAVYLVWGSTFLAIRYAIDGLPGFTMAAARFLLAGSLFLGWARLKGEAWPTARQWRDAFVIGALLLLCGNGGVVWAEHHLATGLTALLIATEPVWVAVLFWLTAGRERPQPRTVAGVLLGFAGAAILAMPGVPGLNGDHVPLFPALVTVLAALAWAAGSLYGRRADQPRSVPQSAGMQMLAGGLLLAIAGGASGEWQGFHPSLAPASSWWALAYLVFFGSLIGFTAYSWLVRTTAPTLVATYAFVNPLVAVFLGWLVVGEPVGWRTLAAGALVVLSVILVSGGERAERRAAKLRAAESERCPCEVGSPAASETA